MDDSHSQNILFVDIFLAHNLPKSLAFCEFASINFEPCCYHFQKGPSTPVTSSGTTTTGTAPTTPVTPETATDGLRYRGANTPTYPQYNMYQ